MYGSAVNRWQRYWFADGGRVGAALVRIGLATAVLLSLRHLATLSTVQLPAPAAIYRPVGVWMLFGSYVPPPAVFTVLWIVAWTSSATMLLGLWSRASTAIAFGSAIALISASFSGSATWSHQYNVVFLAHAAFLGARGGDTLSLDAWIRTLRKLPPIDRPRGYQWSLRLVQLAVALMFAGACFHKLLHGHGTLRWAFTDNLRHHLLVRYDLTGLPRPALVDWIIDDVWKYRTAALLNLISQAAPILAVIFVRRPLVRLAGAFFFTLETLALGFVVTLWNLHWLPLVVVFVDWDWLLRRPVVATPEAVPARAPRIYVIAFFAYELVTAFIPTLDQRLNTYPFSSFPMFATIRAREPYGEHQPYTLPGDHYEVISDVPLDAAEQRWFDHGNRWLYDVPDQTKLRARLTALLATAQARYGDKHIHAIRHYLAIYEAPAYPTPARFDMHPVAITGEIREDGTFRSAFGGPPTGVALAGATYSYYADDVPRAIAIASPADAPADADPRYVVATVDGVPWLVSRRASIKY